MSFVWYNSTVQKRGMNIPEMQPQCLAKAVILLDLPSNVVFIVNTGVLW